MEVIMASIRITDLPEYTYKRLKACAVADESTVGEEAREILVKMLMERTMEFTKTRSKDRAASPLPSAKDDQ
jgi:plasmid stability protein